MTVKRGIWLFACILTPWLVLWLHGKGCEAGLMLITFFVAYFTGMAAESMLLPLLVMLGWIARAVQVYHLQHPLDARRRGNRLP